MKTNYSICPEERHAKAYGKDIQISTKDSIILCKLIRGKKLTVVKKLLTDLSEEKRSIRGKYYTKAVGEFLIILNSCEKNADNLGLDKGKLFVQSSANLGSHVHRRRRKSKFGSRMKFTNIEVFLIECGKSASAVKTGVKQ